MFFGGKAYLRLFIELKSSVRSKKTIFYNSAEVQQAPGVLMRFSTNKNTNWQYDCTNAFIDGKLQLDMTERPG